MFQIVKMKIMKRILKQRLTLFQVSLGFLEKKREAISLLL